MKCKIAELSYTGLRRPTKQGWYWYVSPGGSLWIEEVRWVEWKGRRRLAAIGTAGHSVIDDSYRGTWYGPIREPLGRP